MNYLDTSAMVRAWRLQVVPQGCVTRSHTLAEFYSTLTGGLTAKIVGIETRVKFKPTDAAKAAAETFAGMTFEDLTPVETQEQLTVAAKKNVQSANIHDLMHAAAAQKAGCAAIVTSNERHFKTVTDLKLISPPNFF